jgi:DNA-binding transcriptional LysR family regulator
MSTDKNAIALFVMVVECGSFSQAALRTGVPVSTVSRKIADLEKALGTRLLARSTRRLRTTDIGQDYFERCRRGLAEFDAADALVNDRHAEVAGRLRLSVPPSMSDLVILPLVRAFQARYPGASVQCLATERYVDHIAEGIDLALRIGHPQDSSLVASNVAGHRSLLVAAPGYLDRQAPVAHPDDVAQHVQVAFSRWDKPVHWRVRSGADSASIRPEPRLVFNEYGGVLAGVADGMGVTELPSFICAPMLRDGRLRAVLPAWRFDVHQLMATYPSNRHLAPLVRAFRDFCVDYFQQAPFEETR